MDITNNLAILQKISDHYTSFYEMAHWFSVKYVDGDGYWLDRKAVDSTFPDHLYLGKDLETAKYSLEIEFM